MLEAAGEDLLQTSVRILNQTDWSGVRSQITYVPWFQFRHNILVDIAGSPTFLFN